MNEEPKNYEEWLRKYHGIPPLEALMEKYIF